MSDRSVPKIAKWPFLLGDLLFIGAAVWIAYSAPHPLDISMAAILALCVFSGAWIAAIPFLRQYQAAVKLAEVENLQSTVEQIKDLQKIGNQISQATSQWQAVQEQSQKTAKSAAEIAEKMTAEARGFAEFMQKTNDSEKAHLRLEVDKLRRSETESLQMMVHMLDHVWALNQAGQRSGQPQLMNQLNQFQRACRDVVRRAGLLPITSAPGDAFDDKIHLLPKETDTAPEKALVSELLAPGYTFQGQLLRKAIVVVKGAQANGHSELEKHPDRNPLSEPALDDRTEELTPTSSPEAVTATPLTEVLPSTNTTISVVDPTPAQTAQPRANQPELL